MNIILWTVAALIAGLLVIVFATRLAHEDAALDERDLAILGRAPAAQSVAMLVTLAV